MWVNRVSDIYSLNDEPVKGMFRDRADLTQ